MYMNDVQFMCYWAFIAMLTCTLISGIDVQDSDIVITLVFYKT